MVRPSAQPDSKWFGPWMDPPPTPYLHPPLVGNGVGELPGGQQIGVALALGGPAHGVGGAGLAPPRVGGAAPVVARVIPAAAPAGPNRRREDAGQAELEVVVHVGAEFALRSVPGREAGSESGFRACVSLGAQTLAVGAKPAKSAPGVAHGPFG